MMAKQSDRKQAAPVSLASVARGTLTAITFRSRVDKLDKIIPPLPVPSKDQNSADGIIDLLHETMESAMSGFSEEDAACVAVSLRTITDENVDRSPYGVWWRALREGWCRFPDVTPTAVRDVMLAYADQPASSSPSSIVCNSCGMLLPRDFGPCPVCGTGKRNDGIWDRNWPSLARGTARWTNLDRHLDAGERAER
jgi:hypothetical protein